MGMWYVVYMYMMYEVKCMKVAMLYVVQGMCMWYKVCVCGTRYVYVV